MVISTSEGLQHNAAHIETRIEGFKYPLRGGYGHTGNPTDTQADVRYVLLSAV